MLAEANAKGWGDLPGTAMASGYLGWLALWQGEPAPRDRTARSMRGDPAPPRLGMLGLVTTVHAQACLSAGDIEGAERAAGRGRELAAHDRMPPWWPSLVTALDAMVLVERGQIDRGAAAGAAALPKGPSSTWPRASEPACC